MLPVVVLLAFLAIASVPVTKAVFQGKNQIAIAMNVHAPPTYVVRGELLYTIELNVNVSIIKPADVDFYELMISMPYYSKLMKAEGVVFGGLVSSIYDSHLRPYICVKLPYETTETSLKVYYELRGISTLWRANIAVTSDMFLLKTNIPEPEITWSVQIILPEGAPLLPGYPKAWPSMPIVVEEGSPTIIRAAETKGYISIGYQPIFLELYALVAVTLICITSMMVARYLIRRRTKFEALIGKLLYLSKKMFSVRNMLIGLLLTSTLILAIGAVAGFRPQLRVVVMAVPTTAEQIVSELNALPNVKAYTMSEVGRIEDLTLVKGTDAIVIVDLPALSELERYQLRTIISRELNEFVNTRGTIMVVAEYFDRAPVTGESFGKIFYEAHQESPYLMMVNDVYQLKSLVEKMAYEVQQKPLYWTAVKAQAILVTLLSFFATAFVTGFLLEKSSKQGIMSSLALSVMVGFFVFGLAQLTLMWAGRSMGLPLATHYGAFGLSAYGELSPIFGGGNVLRVVAGLLGVFAGLLASEKLIGGVSWKALIALGAVVVVVSFNPLTSGVVFTEATQVFLSGETFYLRPEAPVLQLDSWLSSVIWWVGSALSIPYTHAMPYISRGVALYFASLLPLLLTPFVKRPVRTFLLAFSGIYIARGIARIGDMSPIALAGSFVPGVVLGAILLAVFLLSDKAYVLLRGRLRFKI